MSEIISLLSRYYPRGINVFHREVFVEKVFKIKINPHNHSGVWYLSQEYFNRVFEVRSCTKKEFEEMVKSNFLNTSFKERCTIKKFFVVLDESCKNQFIGKCDSIII